MNRETAVAKRYAKALFELAQEKNTVLETEQQLEFVVQAITSNHDLQLLLTTPKIDMEGKMNVLRETFKDQTSDTVLDTVQLLIERGRIQVLNDVLDSYVRIASAAINVADAIVTSAVPLPDAEKESVAATFGKQLNKKIRIKNIVDPSIIGGLQVRIGDRLYDGSLSGKLKQLQKIMK
ncbi:F0F1 ATP synthase subunit delta [Paenibacillus aquistagni]|uniref:ATP synthase subunit delta n=1 Tax=Paenibacillus aquistagni TaxID=1852522 RepID=A0A1X7KVB9_9BACL|nr:F0F1 ATP synthase subunit delta [Paenibacillus aquistagni]NMM54363.1 F0F1 ATP synthase subunit delta [Paenibacillus aquistagni]SMG45426.1 ATP synthase F1 subcomplex delta subunit [Paenibacillus aquistagni]